MVDSWLSEWTSFYAEVVGLLRTVPREIFSDYTEAVKCYNIGAYRASVVMSRRALQQALEDRGATKGNRLLDQIDELKSKGIMDKATASLAHGVRHFGNYGAHPQDDLLADVTQDDARLILDVLKKILLILYT